MELGTPSISTRITGRHDCINCVAGEDRLPQTACSIC
jgi:hypothetical protein